MSYIAATWVNISSVYPFNAAFIILITNGVSDNIMPPKLDDTISLNNTNCDFIRFWWP